MKALNRIIDIYKSEGMLKIEWLILGIISFVSLAIFKYQDTDSLITWSLNLLDVIYEGRVREFYSYSALNLYHISHPHVGCEAVALLPWSLWNIPIWIVRRFFEVNILTNALFVIWAKLFLVFALLVTMRYTYLIGIHLTGGKVKSMLMAALSFSSIHVYIGIYYAGQNDIVVIAFSVMAIYYLMNDSTRKFLLFSAFAIALKSFFLFPYIAVILLHEKKMIKVILKLISGYSIILLSKIIFYNAPEYQTSLSSGPTENMLYALVEKGISTPYGVASFFVIGILIIYYICYAKKIEDKAQLHLFTIYAIAAVYALLFLFGHNVFYRYIYLIPFLPILLLYETSKMKINLIISAIVNFLMVVMTICGFSLWDGHKVLFHQQYMHPNVMEKIFPGTWSVQKYYENLYFISDYMPDFLFRVMSAVILFGTIFILVLNFPGIKRIPIPFENEKCSRWIIWCNIFVAIPFLIGVFYIYFKFV